MKVILYNLIIKIFFLCIIKSENFKVDFNYYHTTEEIDTYMKGLAYKYPYLIKETNVIKVIPNITTDYSLLNIYDITNYQIQNINKTNLFIIAGEHPRELISTELAFYFIKKLFNENSKMFYIFNNFYIRIIINSNPYGRKRVENGEYCKRSNLNNVDINRNWDIHFKESINNPEEYPGNKPFSEIETIFIMQSIKLFNAKLFLTLHSGVYGLFLPYAFQEDEAKFNYNNMFNILSKIKNDFCPVCQLGAPSKVIGYKSSGTCLDYIYDNFKVPYALAWEIYSSETYFPALNQYKQLESSFLSIKENQIQIQIDSSKSNKLRKYSTQEINFCSKLFNPIDFKSFSFIINNWLKALLELFDFIRNN